MLTWALRSAGPGKTHLDPEWPPRSLAHRRK